MWHCSNCGEPVDDNFEACWNCQTEKGGVSSQGYFAPPIPRELEDLRDRIVGQSTSDLKRIIAVDFADYRKEALEFARAELKNRGVDIDTPASPAAETTPARLADAAPRVTTQAAHRSNARVLRVLNRYADAYRVARFIVTIGTVTKVVGSILGALVTISFISFAGYVGHANLRYGQDTGGAETALNVTGLFLGAFVFVLFFIAGLIISAQGQILKANLDSAVHTSPFVDDNQKAQIMSLD